jgi:AcrR family transcriptional regulator
MSLAELSVQRILRANDMDTPVSPPTSARSRRERQKAELRAELLAAAHALVQEDGYEGLSIRRLAKRVGYAPMSVYSYFADKHAILRALAEGAFAALARRAEKDQPQEPLAALRKGLNEYAAFGLENPNEYRTVFMVRQVREEGKSFAQMEAENPALQILLAQVRACIEAGHFRGDVRAIATMLWTMTHGAVSLLICFPSYPFGEPREYAAKVVDMALVAAASTEIPALVPEGWDG